MPQYPAPFRNDAFPAVPRHLPPRPPKREDREVSLAPEIGNTVSFPAPRMARIITLKIANKLGAQESASHCNMEPKGPDPGAAHFHFVPGLDDMEVRFTSINAANAKSLDFELWSAVIADAPIWSKHYDAATAMVLTAGAIDFSEITVDDERFPGGVPDVAHAPYQLRATVVCEATGARTTAWTHFDVLVASVELHYGTAAMIPDAPIQDVTATNQPRTRADELALVQALYAARTAVPADGEIPVVLPSTQAAYIQFGEWYGHRDYAFLRHKARWGAGPRIPLVAKVSLKRVDDSAVHSAEAAKALGNAKFLWDWRDRTAGERTTELDGLNAHATARAYILAGMRYQENAVDEPPGCLNAHALRGGKRGGPQLVFPPNDGAGAFPFVVTRAATRRWAAVSLALTAGADACCTGVIFQPSRMALDSYRIRVFLHRPTVDVVDPVDTVVGDHPGLPTAQTGFFAVRRRIDARYITKGPSTSPMDLTILDRAYAVGGIVIQWTRQTWDMGEFRRYFAEALQADAFNEDANPVRGRRHPMAIVGRQRKIRAYVATRGGVHVNTFDHWSGNMAGGSPPIPNQANFTVPGRAMALRPFIAQATRTYIDKPRKIDGVGGRWRKFVRRRGGVEDEAALIAFYNTGLSRKERDKVKPEIKRLYEAAGWLGWDVAEDDEHKWANENYNYKRGLNEINIEMHQRKIMNDDFYGATFFHYTHFYDVIGWRDNAPEVVARQCDIGGLASIGYSADLGYKAAFVVWDHPTNGQRRLLAAQASGHPPEPMKNGNWTSAHEFGHFFHLPHATPTGGGKESAMHDAADLKCVMNYDPDSEHLCGGCALRIAGWARYQHEGMMGVGKNDAGAAGSAPNTFDNDQVRDAVIAVTADL